MMETQGALFEMPAPRGPTEPILRTADIEGEYRWTLSRAWGSGPCLVWCGLNPSTADAKRDDPTMLREMRFSFLWGYGSMVKVNFYPLRSSTTGPLRKWLKSFGRDGPERDAWMKNLSVIAGVLKSSDKPMAVWGNGVSEEHLKLFLDFTDMALVTPEVEYLILNSPEYVAPVVQWHCLDRTLSGAPRHTLARGKHRIPDTQRPALWRTD